VYGPHQHGGNMVYGVFAAAVCYVNKESRIKTTRNAYQI